MEFKRQPSDANSLRNKLALDGFGSKGAIKDGIQFSC